MTNGLSRKCQELRRHLLSHNGPDVVRRMQASGFKDLVRLIIEMTVNGGEKLWRLAGEKCSALRVGISRWSFVGSNAEFNTWPCVQHGGIPSLRITWHRRQGRKDQRSGSAIAVRNHVSIRSETAQALG